MSVKDIYSWSLAKINSGHINMKRTIDTKAVSVTVASVAVGAIFAIIVIGSIVFIKKVYDLPTKTCINNKVYAVSLNGLSEDLNISCE